MFLFVNRLYMCVCPTDCQTNQFRDQIHIIVLKRVCLKDKRVFYRSFLCPIVINKWVKFLFYESCMSFSQCQGTPDGHEWTQDP